MRAERTQRSANRARRALAFIAVAVALASLARADEERSVRLTYRAPGGCPDEASFFAQVRARTSRVRRTVDGRWALDVGVTKAGDETAAHLVLRDPDGRISERDVAGERCDEVVTAIALVAALAIDPMARTEASVSAASPSRSSPPPVSSSPAPPPPPPPPAPPERLHLAPPAAEGWSFGAALGVLASLAAAPVFMVGPAAFFEVIGPAHGPLAPTFRLGATFAPNQSTNPAQGGTATFRWTSGLLDACPFAWRPRGWSLEPCLRFEAGVVQAAGSDVVSPLSATRAWFAAGALGHAAWRFAGPFVLEGDLGLVFPLVRDSYSFFPARDIYDTTAVGLEAGVDLGVRWR